MRKLFAGPHAGPVIISGITVVGFVILVVALAMHVVAESTLLTTVVGILGSKFSSVVDYYLGSSMGEAQKTAQISHLIGQAGDAAAADGADGAAPLSQPAS